MSIKKLSALRDQITALAAERAEVADAPLDRAEAEAHVAEVLKAVQIHPILGPSPAGLRDGSFGTIEMEKLLGKPGFLIALFHDQIKTYLLGIFDAEAGAATGLPMSERRKKLTELDGQIYGLEQIEEALIETLEAAGADIARRPDADPAAALGLAPPREAA